MAREDSIWPGKPGNLGKRAHKSAQTGPAEASQTGQNGLRKCQNGGFPEKVGCTANKGGFWGNYVSGAVLPCS